MMKILLPLHPRFCTEIFNGNKTIEVRRDYPQKLKPPFEALVYRTKQKGGSKTINAILDIVYGGGKVIGSFVCDKITRYESEFWDDNTYECIKELWEPSDFAEYGEYEYDTLGVNGEFYGKQGKEFARKTCLSWAELRKYIGLGLKDFCGWHITAPKLFDKPRELGEFRNPFKCEAGKKIGCWNNYCKDHAFDCVRRVNSQITRAPQSWCYVEDEQ